MILTKELWMGINPTQKIEKMAEVLEQIRLIDTTKHPLSHKVDQGKLSGIKTNLEKFVIDALTWESDQPN